MAAALAKGSQAATEAISSSYSTTRSIHRWGIYPRIITLIREERSKIIRKIRSEKVYGSRGLSAWSTKIRRIRRNDDEEKSLHGDHWEWERRSRIESHQKERWREVVRERRRSLEEGEEGGGGEEGGRGGRGRIWLDVLRFLVEDKRIERKTERSKWSWRSGRI